MLVLTRKRNQSIVIGTDVEVAVIDIRGDQVRLGVAAPNSVAVHRRELYDEVEEANRAAMVLPAGRAHVEQRVREALLTGRLRKAAAPG